ncbi:amino acid adenylation domain-containing protein [Pseudomonas gingeri]|uniref:L-cysteine--[L-cysteinyl-carrier protein] ligase n=1 Tax=Pseudomonas gingeri TaxID=117681 RepID=A0A7Y7YAB2_9PSED|nr:non-ribosomal peptide synthetase [Pseudomonas gingeri]NWB26688.1 amino acid adenylation domain-containing protein [Pseudomonas gingeri]NWC32762.1 amino acid adenylation domain-containing protein [Pseudomonas gingeri]
MFDKTSLREMTPAQFAALHKRPKITPLERTGTPLASFAQRRLWFLAQLAGGGGAYHIPLGLQLRGPLDRSALKRALDRLVARHESLRTTFAAHDDEVVQVIAEPGRGFDWQIHDLVDHPEAEARITVLTEEEADAPFDLKQGPLFRGRVLIVGEQEHVLLLTLHHIICDGWSMAVLTRELGELYDAFRQDLDDPLPAPALQYADYCEWQRRWLVDNTQADHGAYWRDTLAGAPTLLELPGDRPRPVLPDYQGGFEPLMLDATLTEQLKALSLRHGSTLFMTLLAGWAVVLARLSGQSEVLIGTPTANRSRRETEDLIGFFVNTLVLRLSLTDSPTVSQLLEHSRAVTLGAQEHQELPFEQVVEQLNPTRSQAYSPLFQVMFAWENTEPGTLRLSGLESRPLRGGHQAAKFDLTLVLAEQDGVISGGLEYASALFDATTVARFAGYLRRVLVGMVAQPQRPVAELELLDAQERDSLVLDWNRTERAFDTSRCLHELFEARVRHDPGAIAVRCGVDSLDYGELNVRANRLAHELRARGVGPDVRVGLCLERTLDMPLAVLAVLKAGGAYVPLDPGYPLPRLTHMLSDSAPAVVLTHGPARAALLAALDGVAIKPTVLDLQQDAPRWADHPEQDLDPQALQLTSRHLAYVIYTSGSTGQPKGVMVEHRGLVAVSSAWEDLYNLRPGLRHLQMAGFSFDVFSADLIRALGFGGELVLCPRQVLMDPPALYRLLRESEIDFADFVPAVLNPLLAWVEESGQGLSFLDTVICGSDIWTAHSARQLRQCCGERVRIVHAYGVTEASIDSTCFELAAQQSLDSSLPIGRPLANTRIYLLDAAGATVPIGVAGELHIGGVGVARGYLNQAQLSVERFVDNPFVAGERLYRTGDLARYRADGNLEFIGRNDSQAKLRGLRLELGEIEARLAEIDGVRDSLVLLRSDSLGEPRLVAYYRRAGDQVPGPGELREKLARSLPDYMVPSAFVRLDALPLTANGKLDRSALPAPDATAFDQQHYTAPQGPLETELARIWGEVLGIERVGRDDGFFALGGHSLLVIQVIARIRRNLDLNIAASALFAAPQLKHFALRLGDARETPHSSIERVERGATQTLSFAQQRLWFLAQMDGGSAAYHMPLNLRLRGRLQIPALERSLNQLLARHEALRTTFIRIEGEPRQVIAGPGQGLKLEQTVLEGDDPSGERLARLVDEEGGRAFDLERGPLIRARLIRLADDDQLLLLTLHHIVSDGWSMGVLTRELQQLYTAALQDRDDPLPPLALQYVDYSAWQRDWLTGEVLERQSRYWRETLVGAPVLLELPADHKRPPVQDYRGGVVPLVFDKELTRGLKALSRQQGTTLFMTLLAGWALVLARLSGQSEVVIGVPSANRPNSELEALIGFFVNTLALRLNLSDNPSVGQWLQRARTVALQAQEHQDLPFEQVVELLNPTRSLAHSPLFQVLFAWEQVQCEDLILPGLDVEHVESQRHIAKFDLQLALSECNDEIVGGLEYASGLFEPATVVGFGEYLRRVLTQMVADSQQTVAGLDLLSPEQHQQLRDEWNSSGSGRVPQIGFLARFEAQVALTPQAAALLWHNEEQDYAGLNAAANRLAHFLRGQGIGAEDRVGLSLERSPQMVIGLLAILKAGAAYVPFDPAYPAGRLAYMFSDAAPSLLLTSAQLRDKLPVTAGELPLYCLDSDQACWAGQPSDNPELAIKPANLAYVLYTSGSSGRPKGVAHTHQALDNLIDWQLTEATGQAPLPKRVLQFASLNFDVSFQEIFSTLCQGGCLVLMSEEQRKDLANLRPTLVAAGVQRAFLPFAVLQQLAGLTEVGAPMPPGGCDIITAGEALRVNDELRAFVRGLGGTHLYNQYGPTETHVVSQFRLACAEAGEWPEAPPIGRPINNARLYVLDDALNPLPVGVAGELYIAGTCLARGYLNQPGLTAERFLPDPFSREPGARMYRSGDQARRLADGNVQYLGRIDQQVKLRGFRVELGEIDSLLQQQPGVLEAAVLLREDSPGDPRLVAYIVGSATVETLRDALRRHLPEHMIPGAWVTLAQLPLTGNGKLDRRALPAPERLSGGTYVAPVTDDEIQLTAIWAEVLRCERVGLRDNFFDLGGHSLLATRLVYAINQRMSAQLSLSSLFKTPTPGELIAEVRASRDERIEAEPAFGVIEPDLAARHQPFPLTDIQQAYWFGREATVSLGGVSAHGYEELRIRDFDSARFERALNRMIERHDMLRAVFLSDGTQQVLAEVPVYRMPGIDLRGLDPEAARQALESNRQRLSHQVLDASRWPLFEFSLTLLDDGISHLHISLDALIVDAASSQILARELMACYIDPQLELPVPGLGFRDYVLAEHRLRGGVRYERALAYWRERVGSLAPAPDLPLVRQPESLAAPHFTRRDRQLPAAHWTGLKALAKSFAVTPSVVLLTAFCEVLALWSRQPRFTLSLPLFNRLPLHPDVDGIIGDFTSLVLLEVRIDGNQGFIDKARAIQQQLWQDIDHAAVSGVRVLRELSQARGAQQTAIPIVFNSTLSEAAAQQAEYNLADALQAQNVHSITQTPQVWIDHTLLELEGRLLFNWDSIDELFPEGLIGQMFDAYNQLLDRLLEPQAWTASTTQLLPQACLPAPPPGPATAPLMHELFERQALATPTALALIAPDRQLSYEQLRRQARQLGACLQTRGVVPNQLVAVMMERGWEQVVATLAILYAGGAYLPLDPALPAQRVRHILERAEARLVLTQPGLDLDSDALSSVAIIHVTDAAESDGPELQPVTMSVGDLAYVIYTSGSTGVPKGVVIDHAGAVNTLLDINRRFAVGPRDRVLAVSSLSFDLSVYDFFGTLAAGAAVVLLDHRLALDPLHWRELIGRHRISLWNSVPALLGLLLESEENRGGELPASLRLAMLSGDWIPLNLADRARALQPAIEVISLGGATEASIWSICYPIGQVDPDWRSIPYGKALDHQRFHVLDEALQSRPTWVPGQLYIGGIGLAKGYWRDEAQSAASFFSHPLTGERLYRTGDLGRLLPDGNIEFLGREDNQVKVQGYRIELGEIEAVLNRHPGVQSAVLRILGRQHGEKRLAAYVIKADTQLQAGDFALYLTDKLPAYMVPTSFTFLETLPLSANGKVDKSRLPEPRVNQDSSPLLEPQGPREQRLVAIVEALLKHDGIVGNANLLSLGATSIDIVRISNALSAELQFRPHLAQLLAQPTLANLLELYRRSLEGQALVSRVLPPAAVVEEVIEDPQLRQQFKADERGRRRFSRSLPAVALALPEDAGFARRFSDCRSVRRYDPQPIPTTAFAHWLAGLSRGQLEGAVKYQFPSAGGLYPLQAYLYIKPGRVHGVPGGAFYYDPVQHRLQAFGEASRLDPDTYDYFVNRPVYEDAAFALFLIADLAAIRPLYGERSRDFCRIEAGAMAQLLTMTAVEQGLGLCGMGSIDEQSLPALFDLGPSHQLVYSLVGGLRAAGEQRNAQLEAFATAHTDDDSDMEEIEV